MINEVKMACYRGRAVFGGYQLQNSSVRSTALLGKFAACAGASTRDLV